LYRCTGCFTAQAPLRILKLAPTIADLAGGDRIRTVHLACRLHSGVLRKAMYLRPAEEAVMRE
jgi:predicted ATPase with chaperone activity